MEYLTANAYHQAQNASAVREVDLSTFINTGAKTMYQQRKKKFLFAFLTFVNLMISLPSHADISLSTCTTVAPAAEFTITNGAVKAWSNGISYGTHLTPPNYGCARFVVDINIPIGTYGTFNLEGSAKAGGLPINCWDYAADIKLYIWSNDKYILRESMTKYATVTDFVVDQNGQIDGGTCGFVNDELDNIIIPPGSFGATKARIAIKGYRVSTGEKIPVFAYARRVGNP
jgi:hypothetical protein